MSTSEKYISESLIKKQPKVPVSLKLKDSSVTTRKIADGSVTAEKLDTDLIEKLAAYANRINRLETDIKNLLNGGIVIGDLTALALKEQDIEDAITESSLFDSSSGATNTNSAKSINNLLSSLGFSN